MAKRRKKDRLDTQIQPSPKLVNEMRGLVQATRSRSDLRSLTPTQAKVRINELYQETVHEYKNLKRRTPESQVLGTQVPGRSKANIPPVRGERLPAKVRDLFQDAQRALVCSKRETRREVMHALQRTGRAGARRNQKARWRSDSYVSCKKGR